MLSDMNPLISICIPVFDEEKNILPLYQELISVIESLSDNYEFEIIFTDNNSEDETWEKIKDIAFRDLRVKALRFTRNIGFQQSIIANLEHSSGVAVIQIDADRQDPANLIYDFIKEWERGFKVVYGVRIERQENLVLNTFRKLGYRFISHVSDYPIPPDAGDFRLMDREVVDRVVLSSTPKPYLRGIIASYGYVSAAIPYKRRERVANKSKFPARKIFNLGLDGVFNHSSWPLKFSSYIGVFVLIFSLILSVYYFALKILRNDLSQGLASIQILVTLGIGINALFLGIIGNYLNRIYLILRDEPKFIVRDQLNFRAQN